MRRNTTLEDEAGLAAEASEPLTPRQQRAVEGLLGGGSVSSVARQAGVHRSTIHRWLQRDCHFIAALNRARMAQRSACTARLESMADLATEVIQEALRRKDVRTALALVRGLGLLDAAAAPLGSGSADADVLGAEFAADAARRQATSSLTLLTSVAPLASSRHLMQEVANARNHFAKGSAR